MSSSADERKSISIIQAMDEAKKGLIDLKAVSLKNRQTNMTTERYFWNRVGHKGSLSIEIGDMTKPESSWPFLLREPSKHPDQGDEQSTLGAFTAIPDPEERDAFLWFREWMLERIFEKKVVKGKKGESLESVRTEVAQLGILPETDGQHFCFNQKLQPGGSIESLRTQAFAVYTSKAADGSTEYEEGPGLDVATLRASSTIFTNVDFSELKRSQGKWRTSMYTRKLVCVSEKTEPVQETSFRIGGVVIKRRDASAAATATAMAMATATLVEDDGGAAGYSEYAVAVDELPMPVFASTSGVPDTTFTSVTVCDKKTFGDAVAEDIARLSAATSLKRPASATQAITVPLLPEDGATNKGEAAAAPTAAQPAAKRVRVVQ